MSASPAVLEIQAGTSPAPRRALILHGILGSAKNWRSFARRLARARPDVTFLLADLRGHGDSPSGEPPHDLKACARDLEALGKVDAVIGHSFGGKVALTYAAHAPQPPAQVWVLDSNPWPATENLNRLGGAGIFQLIEMLQAIPMPLPSRDALVETLLSGGFSRALALWMTTNLARTDTGFHWRFDVPVVSQLLTSYLDADAFPLLERRTGSTHLVKAARTEWPAEDVARLEALSATSSHVHLHILPDAGHWVHVDAPEALASLLGEGLAVS